MWNFWNSFYSFFLFFFYLSLGIYIVACFGGRFFFWRRWWKGIVNQLTDGGASSGPWQMKEKKVILFFLRKFELSAVQLILFSLPAHYSVVLAKVFSSHLSIAAMNSVGKNIISQQRSVALTSLWNCYRHRWPVEQLVRIAEL